MVSWMLGQMRVEHSSCGKSHLTRFSASAVLMDSMAEQVLAGTVVRSGVRINSKV